MKNEGTEIPSVITRTMFCEECYEANRPNKQTLYVVYGSGRKEHILYLHIGEVPKINIGFTPHLISNSITYVNTKGIFVKAKSVCSIVGCGLKINFSSNYKTSTRFDYIKKPKYMNLIINQFKGLLNFKDSGFQLSSIEDGNWDWQAIAKEQIMLAEKFRSQNSKSSHK
jgi:hypothetical protein